MKAVTILKKLLNIWCKASLILVYIFAIPILLFGLLTIIQIGYAGHIERKCKSECYNRDEEKESQCFKSCFELWI